MSSNKSQTLDNNQFDSLLKDGSVTQFAQIESLVNFIVEQSRYGSQVKIKILNHEFNVSLNKPINCLTVILLITVEKKLSQDDKRTLSSESNEVASYKVEDPDKFYAFLSYEKNKTMTKKSSGFTYFPFKSNLDIKIDITDSSFIVNDKHFGTIIGLDLDSFLNEFSQIVTGTLSQEVQVPSIVNKYLKEINVVMNTFSQCSSIKNLLIKALKEFFLTTINALNNKFYYSLIPDSLGLPAEKRDKIFYKCSFDERKAWTVKLK